eukprot:COSAG01_NODE_74631_length_206_cov_43.682243_1_plen_35_part_10
MELFKLCETISTEEAGTLEQEIIAAAVQGTTKQSY